MFDFLVFIGIFLVLGRIAFIAARVLFFVVFWFVVYMEDDSNCGGVHGVSEDIKNRVVEAIIDCLKLKEEQKQALNGNTNLAKDFNLDSLDFVDLIMSLEERFSIEISDEEAQSLETVDDICRYVQGKSNT